MQDHWIMLANASRARICCIDKRSGALVELADFVHPQSRQRAGELADDRSGHVALGVVASGRGGAALAPHSDPHAKAREAFALQLAGRMEDAVADGECRSWVLLASNPFLGDLKAQLGRHAKAALRTSVALDLTGLQQAELRQRLDEVLQLGS